VHAFRCIPSPVETGETPLAGSWNPKGDRLVALQSSASRPLLAAFKHTAPHATTPFCFVALLLLLLPLRFAVPFWLGLLITTSPPLCVAAAHFGPISHTKAHLPFGGKHLQLRSTTFARTLFAIRVNSYLAAHLPLYLIASIFLLSCHVILPLAKN
jgi:hypothetical protein